MAKRLLLVVILCVTFSYAFSQDLSITSSLPTSGSAGQAIEARYTLTKSSTMGSFAKFQVDLPAGFDAQSSDLKGGNFTFEKNNRVKIVWVSLPGDASFDFVFKITASAGVSGNVTLAPMFYYLENNAKKEYTVPTSVIDFGGGGGSVATTDNTSSSGSNTSTTDNTQTTNTGTTDNTSNNNANTTDNSSGNTNTQSTNTTDNTASNNNTSSNNTSNTNASTNSISTATAKSNVVYHVQLAALTNKPTKARFAQYGDVKIVEDAGLHKVLVGKFKTLEEARAYKKKLLANGTEGCFVVAYENGVRVKIQ